MRSSSEGVLFNQRWNVNYDHLKIIAAAESLDVLFLSPLSSQEFKNVSVENCSTAALCWESEGQNWTLVNSTKTENLEKCKRASITQLIFFFFLKVPLLIIKEHLIL